MNEQTIRQVRITEDGPHEQPNGSRSTTTDYVGDTLHASVRRWVFARRPDAEVLDVAVHARHGGDVHAHLFLSATGGMKAAVGVRGSDGSTADLFLSMDQARQLRDAIDAELAREDAIAAELAAPVTVTAERAERRFGER